MINLLNPTQLRELKAARVNVLLRRFAILTFVTIGIIGLIYGVCFKIADDEYSMTAASSSAAEQTLKNYEAVKTTAKEYQSNLTIAKKILGSQITFSVFITELAAALPPNTVLDSLTLSTKSIGATNGKPTSTALIARAKGYNDVLALKTSLEKKTNLFSGLRITSTSLSTSTTGIAAAYPYIVTFSVVIAQQGTTK